MKKLKWLLVLLLACCFIGCGKGDESESSKKETTEESEDKKDIEKEDEDEGKTKKPKDSELYEVTADNVADIFGLWYDENSEWKLLIFNSYDDFPNIGRAVLTNDEQDYLLCLDEKGREGKGTFKVSNEDGKSYKANMYFTEDGILLESISKLDTEEMFFTRDGLYESEPVGGDRYSARTNEDFWVVQEVSGGGKTYYLLSDSTTGGYLIAYVNSEDKYPYEASFFCVKEANVFDEKTLKGFPVIQLVNYEILSELDYYKRYYGYDDGTGSEYEEEDYTPVCNFPKTYDWSYYDEDTGLWVVANTTTNRRPFKMTGVELLEWESKYISFIGRIKNEGTKTYKGFVDIYLCNEKGETLKSTYNSFKYFPDGYTITGSGAGTRIAEEISYNEPIPAGEEGVFGFYTDRVAIDISAITQPIHYIYIVLDEYWECYDD